MNSRPIDEWNPGFRASDMPVVEGGEPNPLEDAPADVPPGTDGCDPKPTNNLPPPPGAPMVEYALYYARRLAGVSVQADEQGSLLHGRLSRGNDRRRDNPQVVGILAKGDDRRAHGTAYPASGPSIPIRRRSRRSLTVARYGRVSFRSTASYQQRTPR